MAKVVKEEDTSDGDVNLRLKMSAEAYGDMLQMMDLLKADNAAEVITKSLALYRMMIKEEATGGKVVVVRDLESGLKEYQQVDLVLHKTKG